MRCRLLLVWAVLSSYPSLALGVEGSSHEWITVQDELHGPLLPAVSEESRGIVRLASAFDPAPTSSDQTALLRGKLAELDRLTEEVQRLRAATQTAHSIFVNVEVLEVSLTKMRALGVGISPTEGAGVQMSGEAAGELITMIKENNVGRTLACPSLVMVSGRPASFFVGSQIPIPSPAGGEKPVDYVQAGIGLDVTADSLGSNRVRVRVKPRISAAIEPNAAGDEQPAIPKLKVWQCDASCEMEFGQTIILPSVIEQRIEAKREEGGRVVETSIDVARWVVVHVEDAANANVARRFSTDGLSAPKSELYTPRAVTR